jgi:hypothetical protein
MPVGVYGGPCAGHGRCCSSSSVGLETVVFTIVFKWGGDVRPSDDCSVSELLKSTTYCAAQEQRLRWKHRCAVLHILVLCICVQRVMKRSIADIYSSADERCSPVYLPSQ